MKAEADLDYEVATEVMGWKSNPNPDKFRARAINHYGQPVFDVVNIGQGCDAYEEIIFRPSVSIEHAWEVAETLRQRGEFVGVMWNGQQWECALNKVMRKADTAPLAICEAALAALRATEGKGL